MALATTARTTDHLDVFWAGRDGWVWSNWWDQNANNGQWNQPFTVALAADAEPGAMAAVARLPEHLDVFWAGRDGSVWSDWWDQKANNGQWNQPFRISTAGSAEPGAIAAVARLPEHLDVFWIGRDGSVWSNWWDQNANNGQWNQPFPIAPAGNAEPGSIAVVARLPEHLDVFWVGPDGSVWSNWWNQKANNGQWNQPFRISTAGSAEPGAIAAVARLPEHLDVFWIGRDGSVWTNWWDQTISTEPTVAIPGLPQWNLPYQVAPGGNAEPGAITAVARLPEHLDVFWVGRDGSVWANWWDQTANNGQWNQPFTIAQAGNAEPGTIAAVSRLPEHLDVYWLGPDGAVWTNWWDQSTPATDVIVLGAPPPWNLPFRIAAAGNAEPMSPRRRRLQGSAGAVAREANHLDVFWGPSDGSVWTTWWDQSANNGLWNQPFEIAPAGSAAPSLMVTTVAREANHLDVFWVGPDGSVRTTWWDLFDNNGKWNQPFEIAPAGSAQVVVASYGPLPGLMVSAVAREANHLDVFWIGPDGSVRTTWWDLFDNNGRWNQPFEIAPAGSASADSLAAGPMLAAIARQANHLDVFWVGSAGGVWSNWWDLFSNTGHWNQPFQIPGGVGFGLDEQSTVAAVARGANHLDVFWTDADAKKVTCGWDLFNNNGQWSEPLTIGGPEESPYHDPVLVAAVARETNHLDAFWIAPDGSVWTSCWDQSIPTTDVIVLGGPPPWSTPYQIAQPGSAEERFMLAAVARESNHLDVFWIGQDGSVRTTWWDLFINNGQWNQSFEIGRFFT